MRKRWSKWGGVITLASAMVLGLIVLSACQGEPGETGAEGPPGPPGDIAEITCTQCHDDTTRVLAKRLQWENSVHGTGTAYGRSTSAGCAGCHSSEGRVAMIEGGISSPEDVPEGVTNPTPPNCRTCHEIHNTYTEADFTLRTTEPVTLFASGETFDMGDGNLCAGCHQSRRQIEAENGMVNVSSTHWGPHHGPQSDMLLGITGAGDVSGSPSVHYMVVTDGCAVCHMVNDRHEMEPNVAACQACHGDVSNFDIGGTQTEVEELIIELAGLLGDKGMLLTADHEPYHEGIGLSDLHPVVGEYPEAEAAALWNWIYIALEDKSMGVHNPPYIKALLEASIEALQ